VRTTIYKSVPATGYPARWSCQ